MMILASASPRRKQLLEQIGLNFKVVAAGVDESGCGELPPGELVEQLSQRKAAAVAERVGQDDLIIAADTVVSLEGTALGKPSDEGAAYRMLTALSGVRHQVYTGLTLRQGEKVLTRRQQTTVTFRELSEEEITAYIATGEPIDKAGAYGIQGMGAVLVESIEGDYYNVMGLPLCLLCEMLKEFGVEVLQGEDD